MQFIMTNVITSALAYNYFLYAKYYYYPIILSYVNGLQIMT